MLEDFGRSLIHCRQNEKALIAWAFGILTTRLAVIDFLEVLLAFRVFDFPTSSSPSIFSINHSSKHHPQVFFP